MAHMPMTNSTLNTAEPTIVVKPTSVRATKSPIVDVASSGAEPPAACCSFKALISIGEKKLCEVMNVSFRKAIVN